MLEKLKVEILPLAEEVCTISCCALKTPWGGGGGGGGERLII